MKLLTIAVPCYNSREYMHYCIQSLVTGGDLVGVLIINDGSSDETQSIAEKFEQQYPALSLRFLKKIKDIWCCQY